MTGEIRKQVQHIVSEFFAKRSMFSVWMTIIMCLNLGMGAKDDIGKFPSFCGLKDMEHNIGDWDFQRITAALLLPLQ